MAVAQITEGGGEWFCLHPGQLTDIRRAALRAASMTGKIEVIHRHGAEERCEGMWVERNDDVPPGLCFWVWPDVTWAGGNCYGLELPDFRTRAGHQPSVPSPPLSAPIPYELTEAEQWALKRTGNQGG